MEDDSPVLALSTLKKKRYSDVPLIVISLETLSHSNHAFRHLLVQSPCFVTLQLHCLYQGPHSFVHNWPTLLPHQHNDSSIPPSLHNRQPFHTLCLTRSA